jgi:hypothetical protein
MAKKLSNNHRDPKEKQEKWQTINDSKWFREREKRKKESGNRSLERQKLWSNKKMKERKI